MVSQYCGLFRLTSSSNIRRTSMRNQELVFAASSIKAARFGAVFRNMQEHNAHGSKILCQKGKIRDLIYRTGGHGTQNSCIHDTLHLRNHYDRHGNNVVEYTLSIVHNFCAEFISAVYVMWIA